MSAHHSRSGDRRRSAAAPAPGLPAPEVSEVNLVALSWDDPAPWIQLAAVATLAGASLQEAIGAAAARFGGRWTSPHHYRRTHEIVGVAYHLGLVMERRPAATVDLQTGWGMLAADTFLPDEHGRTSRVWLPVVRGLAGLPWDGAWVDLGQLMRKAGWVPCSVLVPVARVHD